jgi:hypothetical protein
MKSDIRSLIMICPGGAHSARSEQTHRARCHASDIGSHRTAAHVTRQECQICSPVNSDGRGVSD